MRFQRAFVPIVLALTIPACGGQKGGMASSGSTLGQDHLSGPQGTIPHGSMVGGNLGPGGATPAIGPGCHSNDPNHICLAVKWVAYKGSNGAPVVSPQEAVADLQSMNQIWNQCDIGFQIEDYIPMDPGKYGLSFSPSNYSELDGIRKTMLDDNSLLVMVTGTWDRSGTLGNTGANAWTAMPGGPPYGSVLEAPVGKFGGIIAHELGHYLNLLHVSDTSDLMDPVIYDYSTTLDSGQCSTARSAASYYWSKMMR